MFWGRKLFLVLCIALLGVGVISAQDLPTVTVWIDAGTDASCTAPLLREGFNSTSENARVEIVEQPEAWNVTRTAVAGGGGPDVVISPGPSFVFEMAAAGLILPLDDYADALGWRENFVPWALSLGEVNDVLYSLPHELETLILYYNRTLFEENGWEVPSTMAGLFELAAEIQAAGITPFAHGNADWRPANEWFVGEFLNHVAGPVAVYEALIGERPWTDPAFVEAMDLLNQMQQNGWFSDGLEFYFTTDTPARMAAFGAGEAAMNIEGTWRFGNIDNYFGEAAGNNNEWDWAPIPSATGDEIFTIGIGSTWSINAASPHPDLAAEYLTYFFSPAVQAMMLAECGEAPGPINLEADAMEGVDPRIASAFDAFADASNAGNYGYTTWTFWPPRSDVYIYEEVERIWVGQITVEEYLEGLNTLFAEELAAGDIPPIPER
jgi:raffinose/stachyose/melibiose transport system substrate-binding protein